jgi:hypothetical protein
VFVVFGARGGGRRGRLGRGSIDEMALDDLNEYLITQRVRDRLCIITLVIQQTANANWLVTSSTDFARML